MSTAPSRRGFLAAGLAAVLAACGRDRSRAAPASTREVDDRHRAGPLAFTYGADAHQVADLWLPAGGSPGSGDTTAPGAGRPVLVLLHGGYWRPIYDRSLMEPLALDAVARGWAAWNLEYRVPGQGRGGWPGTFLDVAKGLDHLAVAARLHGLDLGRVAVVGHSAGGCLALWAAGRGGLPRGAPGADPEVRPGLAVSLAGVNDLVTGAAQDLGAGAVVNLMGGPPPAPGALPGADDRYGLASPTARLPIGVPVIVVHGGDDAIVPLEQTVGYAAKAKRAGDVVTVLTVDGADHFDVIDPTHRSWLDTTSLLARFFKM